MRPASIMAPIGIAARKYAPRITASSRWKRPMCPENDERADLDTQGCARPRPALTGSHQEQPAVDHERVAGRVRGARRGEPADERRDLARIAGPSERDSLPAF